MNPHGSPPRQTSPTPNLRKQLTFHDNTSTYFLMKWHLRNEHRNSILTACVAGASYWWHTQIWVVLLIGWSKFLMHHNQSEALPRSGKHHASVWNFCTWWRHKMLAVSSGGSRRGAQGGPPPPVIFRPNWGPKGRNIFCFNPPPPIPGSGWPGPPLSEGQDLPLVSLVKPRPPLELNLWLSLSAKHCWNPCFGPLPVYQDLSMCHDWPV